MLRAIMTGFIAGILVYGVLVPVLTNADANNSTVGLESSTLVRNGHLTICKLDKSHYEVVRAIKMMVTGYSSTEDQTDDTPFITASGRHVEDGIIAINGLPFGTKVRIPALFGDKVFDVQDRMNERMGQRHADVWFASTKDAIKFGAEVSDIEIVES